MTATTITRPRPFDRAPNAPLVLTPSLLAIYSEYGDDLLDFIDDHARTTCRECDNDLGEWALYCDALCPPCTGEAAHDAWLADAYDRAGNR